MIEGNVYVNGVQRILLPYKRKVDSIVTENEGAYLFNDGDKVNLSTSQCREYDRHMAMNPNVERIYYKDGEREGCLYVGGDLISPTGEVLN